jgi:hypothetical protein
MIEHHVFWYEKALKRKNRNFLNLFFFIWLVRVGFYIHYQSKWAMIGSTKV